MCARDVLYDLWRLLKLVARCVVLQKNSVRKDNETLQKLNSQMLTKDPFYKPPPQTPDAESLASKP